MSERLEKMYPLLDMLIDDNSVPRNVRTKMADAKARLQSSDDFSTKISAAVYALDEVSNDVNLPMHARTLVWNLLSELEALKNRA
ncbi:UPF0147 family protein [Candidatus Micrarchaeota archaeon]|nr:UPF0147 family protein [Candidatus Micrarchaeota archaeon]